MIKGLKFLFKRGFRSKVLNISCAVLAVGMIALVIAFHESLGEEDYLICKLFPHFGVLMFAILSGILLCTDLVGNRAMRAAPISKEIRLYSIPLYNTIVPFSLSAIMNIAYVVFVLAAGLDINNISDMLILSSATIASLTIFSTLGMNIVYGMLFMIYAYFPVAAMGFIIPDHVWEFGFGAPLWAAVLIHIGVCAAASGISFIIAWLFYKYDNFKPMVQQSMPNA